MSASPPAQGKAQLAALLTEAFAEAEQAKSERDAAIQRAQQAEHLLQVATSAAPASSPSGSSSNNDAHNTITITALQSLNATHQRTIIELNARLKAISDAWTSFDQSSSILDSRSADAKTALRKTIVRLASGSDSDASPPLPPPFQNPSLSRKSSRTAGIHPHHPSLQIPPGAPGGRPTSQAGVPANLPPVPIPSGVVVGRVRPREDSLPRRRSEDEPPSARRDPGANGAGDPSSEERPHRLSADDTDSVHDHLSEGERHRKRLRADAGPAPSTSVPPSSRRDRAALVNDSPRSANAQLSPQYTFPHRPPYPPSQQSGQQPHPYANEHVRLGASEASAHPSHLHIGAERTFRMPGLHHHIRGGSDSTIPSAITPTSAATTMSGHTTGSSRLGGRSAGSQDSYPPLIHRHSRSGDVRMDSLGDNTMMIGSDRVESPPPMTEPPQRRSSGRAAYSEQAERDVERRHRESDRRDGAGSMDVDDGSGSGWPRKRERGDDDDKNSVDEFLMDTAINPATGGKGPDEEQDQLQHDDREMSPMSVSQHRRNLSVTGVERWRELDRQRDLEREAEGQGAEQQVHFPGQNGLVKVKEKSGDKFRHYLYNNPSPSTSPHIAPSPHHNQTFPITPTFSMTNGQLTQTGRRGTIAGFVTTPSDREFSYSARASFQAQQHSRRHSNENGPPSANVSHPSLSGPPSGGGPLSAGSSTSILYPHSQQPRHTGPGPAVKPTLNAQGQRTCRQCGQPGRYKDGKCVEKWGPGPAGPGTVCDRCRKKMKRVERRGTQDAAGLGQHIPLVPLTPNQQSQIVSPRQFLSNSYPRSPGAEGQQREYQFQPPLSAASSTWHRGSKDYGDRSARTASAATSPPQSAKPRDRDQAKPSKEKRRAPSYSESPSPPPPEEEAPRDKSASQPQSGEDDPAPSGAATSGSPTSAPQRKNSGDTALSNEMERAADHLMGELDEDAEVSPAGTMVKDKDAEDDADADGDLEDAVGEEEEADADGGVVESDQDPQQRPSAVSASRKASSRPSNSSSTNVVREKEQNLKTSWVKLEDDVVPVA